ncbi:phosphoglycerate dehydrogenase [Oceanobacillus sp. CAU 1775]
MTTLTLDRVKTIKTLNNIAENGLKVFKNDNYIIDNSSETPDAIVVRSYNMHELEFDQNLKAIARAGAGVNNIPVEKHSEKGVVVFNTPGANANAVKEIVLTSLMASSRNLFDGIEWAKTLTGKGEQVPQLVEAGKKQFVGKEIKGKKLGVIGLGSVGALVANDALSLDMDVIGFDPYISIDTAWKLSRNIERAMSVEEVFEEADFITVHVPLTKETKDLFNKKAFQIMQPGVHILNFSRGGLVNEDDLEEAIEAGIVGKYITDFPNDKILQMRNVVPLPHLGASTRESEENCAIMATKQVKDFLETGNIVNAVNFPNASLPFTGKKRITVFHHNVPNMVGQMSTIISGNKLNIAAMINKSRGGYAYTMIDIDEEITGDILTRIESEINQIEDVIRIRVI